MSKALDPRIRAFSRQAAAIMVAEGGLSSECQAKLRRVAQHLRMSDVEFLDALTELQAIPPLTQELSRYELHYVNFLKREFAKLASNILTLPVENRALELATGKYQIGLARARQLLEGTCEELGIHRISVSDAEGFIEQALNEMVGTEVFLSSEQTARLQLLAKSWGISNERMDELIEVTLAANWRLNRLIRRRHFVRRVCWSSTALLIVGITVYSVQVYLNRDEPPQPTLPVPLSTSGNSEHEWWPKTLLETAESVLARHPEMQGALATAARSPVETRLQLYREWAGNVTLFSDDDSTAATTLLLEIIAQDPDAADRWLDRPTVRALVVPVQNDLRVGTLLAQANGWRLLGKWKKARPDLSPEVEVEIHERLELRTDSDRDASQSQGLHQYWLDQQWNRLASLTDVEPAQALVLTRTLLHLPGFETLTPHYLESANRVATDVLLSHPKIANFEVIAKDIAVLLGHIDELQLERWLEVAARLPDPSIKRAIFGHISRLLAVNTNGLAEQDMINAMENRKTELRRRRLNSVVHINEIATTAEDDVLTILRQTQVEKLPHDQLPEETTAVMRAANLSLLALVAARRESSSRESASELLQISSPLFFGPSLRVLGDNSAAVVMRADEKRALQSLLAKIGESDPDNTGLRIAALKQLAERAATIEDLNHSEARQLAQYFLRDLELSERIAAEQAVLAFRKWPQFILALADEMELSKINQEEALSLAQLIQTQDFQLKEPDSWRSELKQTLLKFVFAQLENDTVQEISLRKQRWMHFQRFVGQSYNYRCELLTGQVPTVESSSLVVGIAAQMISGQFTTGSDEVLSAALQRLYPDEFARTIPLQREFLIAVTRRFGQNDVQSADRVRDELLEIGSGNKTVAMMFFHQELLLLKSLVLIRRAAFEDLMQGGGW